MDARRCCMKRSAFKVIPPVAQAKRALRSDPMLVPKDRLRLTDYSERKNIGSNAADWKSPLSPDLPDLEKACGPSPG